MRQSGGHVKIYSEVGARHDGEALPAATDCGGRTVTRSPRTRRLRRGEASTGSFSWSKTTTMCVRMPSPCCASSATACSRPSTARARWRSSTRSPSSICCSPTSGLPNGMNGRQLADEARPAPAAAARAVHHRLRAQCDRAPGQARRGRRADHQAFHLRRAGGQGSSHHFEIEDILRILIVEDNADVANSLADLLKSDGFADVSIAPDGETALASIRRTVPDLVLCDLGLPGSIDGFGVARACRREQTPAERAPGRANRHRRYRGAKQGARRRLR